MGGSHLHAVIRALALLAVVPLAACATLRQRSPADSRIPVVIHDVTVVDVVSGTLRPHTTVIAVGTRIGVVTNEGRPSLTHTR